MDSLLLAILNGRERGQNPIMCRQEISSDSSGRLDHEEPILLFLAISRFLIIDNLHNSRVTMFC